MRNLRNIRYEVCRTDADITGTCWDAGRDEILVAFGPSETEARISLARIVNVSGSSRVKHNTVTSWDAPSPNPDLLVDSIVDIHHFSDSSTTCLVLAGGDIVVVQESDDGVEAVHIEIVGSIDAGIAAARWSWDDELLVLVTKADTVIFMSRNFDAITEVTMTAEDLKASKHVSVGWGKKETQFQGRGAKAAALRDPTIPEKVDQGVRSPHDDGRTAISWRGDGAYVAINSVDAAGSQRRVIRVYTREGLLDSASEPVDGMEAALSWRPAGNLIAGIQRLSDRVDVIFFERNGLRHGQFTLRFPDSGDFPPDIGLEWNSDSTVLAVTFGNVTQLWTMGNYHWYLKQELRGESGATSPRAVWHPEKPLRLAAATASNLVHTEWIFHTSKGAIIAPHDHGAVAVIDGRTLKVTPFRTANVPPPMALFELSLPSSIIDVAFTSNMSSMAVLHHLGIEIYSWETKAGRSLLPKRLDEILFVANEFRAPDFPAPFQFHHPLQVSFSGENEIWALHSSDGVPQLAQFLLDRAFLSSGRLCSTPDADLVCGISTLTRESGMVLCTQNRSGHLSDASGNGELVPLLKYPSHLPWFEVVSYGEGADELLAFGLSRAGHLYANTRQLAKNCTSFLVTADHLIFTTSNHFLKFVHLTSPEELEVPPDDPETDERCRSIERGARLITAVPSNMSLVLQMPRGNLETIYPRAMVVAGIRQLIDGKHYGKAFACCRTQRVDMNILYDHRPDQFLSNVGLFLGQLKDVSYIDLFLSSLREEDVAQTMYKDTRPTKATTGPYSAVAQFLNGGVHLPPVPAREANKLASSSKVNTICDAVLNVLQSEKSSKNNLQNIITAHVCRDPPALDDGLLVVASLMQQQKEQRKQQQQQQWQLQPQQEDDSLAERAVEHICFLVDVNRLYDHALGLYDLDLTLLVAQQSQRDPREYLPFIQSLHALSPEPRRRFAIDDHLGHREKALAHLAALEDNFDAVRDYTVRHGLYTAALALYRYDEARTRVLTRLFAADLEARSRFREAGLAYESLGEFRSATACYRSAGTSCWRECLFAAQQRDRHRCSSETETETEKEQQQGEENINANTLAELASALADALHEAKDYVSAAQVHAEYLSDPEAAVRSLCKGHRFADALLLAARQESSSSSSSSGGGNGNVSTTTSTASSLEAAVDAGLVDALASTTEFLADCKAQLRAQVPRILELRRKAVEDPLSFYEGDQAQQQRPGDDSILPDDVSVAASSRLSTSASLFTRYTGKDGSLGTAGTGVSRASSRNRKREEKKRARGRKGTVYEEEYLVNSVRRLVERVGGAATVAEVEALVFALVRRGMGERARAVEGLLGEVVEGCRAAVGQVWPAAMTAAATTTGAAGAGGGGSGPAASGLVAGGGLAEVVLGEEGGGVARSQPPALLDFKRLSLLS